MKQWTVKELIELLQEFPSDMRVLVDGYEGGYDDLVVRQKKVFDTTNDSSDYEGRYDLWYAGDDGVPFEALLLQRS